MNTVIGWDIGGVHLKAARAEDGCVVHVMQIAAPLRAGVERLAEAFGRAKAELGAAQRHVVTMTGELADTFTSRPDGVECLAMLAARELGETPMSIYAGPAGYIRPEQAREHASLVGSATTDVVPIKHGKVAARGYTDAQRLAAGELVYTGLVRGFVMASADRAPFKGAWMPLINENFANMADVHRILGSLPADVDMMPTTDGREKTREASRARLARMVGADNADASEGAWKTLAQWFAEMQIRAIIDAVMLVNSQHALPADAPVIGAGIGAHVVQEIARRIGRGYVAFDALLDVAPQMRVAASQCAPAAALALLNA